VIIPSEKLDAGGASCRNSPAAGMHARSRRRLLASSADGRFAPLPIRLKPGKFRDPDIVYLRSGRIVDPRHQPHGADLAIEVVSDDEEDRQRDLETKRVEYAEAGIAEYWIVDPREHTILVLALAGSTYRVYGEFARGATAASRLLSGFTASVDAVFASGESER